MTSSFLFPINEKCLESGKHWLQLVNENNSCISHLMRV